MPEGMARHQNAMLVTWLPGMFEAVNCLDWLWVRRPVGPTRGDAGMEGGNGDAIVRISVI